LILIISTEKDDHTQAILRYLKRDSVEVHVLDLSMFPRRMQLSINYRKNEANLNYLRDGHNNISLSSCKIVWWRRPQPLEIHPEMTNSAHRYFATNECQEALSGLWLGLDAKWINHPTRTEEAALKSYQLKVAQRVGLETPVTLITNSPEEAEEFITKHGINDTVYKAFSATEQNWRETRLVKPEELSLLDNLRFAPVIFQEYVPAQLDLRITIVGEDIFAASIYSQETSYKVDYRMDLSSARIEPYGLPKDIADLLRTLMHRLGLIYGAVDMRLTPDGRFVFLEINPAGQWMFIEEYTKQPVTETFAKLLSQSS
jgi:MvdD pre-ATP grasp domain/RimK-like ATP-grasp domain